MSLLGSIRYFLTQKGREAVGCFDNVPHGSLGMDILRYLYGHGGATHNQILRDLGSPTGMWWTRKDVSDELSEFVDVGLVDFEVEEK